MARCSGRSTCPEAAPGAPGRDTEGLTPKPNEGKEAALILAKVRTALILLGAVVAFCAFVIALATQLRAQPIFPVDRFGYLWAQLSPEAWVQEAQQRDEYQQWIHDNRPSCCDHRDCAPASVEWTPHGWKVAGADNYVAERQVIAWPHSIPYACVINRYVRCLFLNSGG